MNNIFLALVTSALIACSVNSPSKEDLANKNNSLVPTSDSTPPLNLSEIESRYSAPLGYTRTPIPDTTSYAYYLRNLALKPEGSYVKYYNGDQKRNTGVYSSVIDLPIGNKDLHQCADGIIHLRARYFFEKEMYDSITFNLTNGFSVPFSKWANGQRVRVKGNTCSWYNTSNKGYSESIFWSYLEFVFMYAGTLSLDRDLNQKSWSNLKIGDVIINGGSPGHGVVVIDMVKDSTGAKKKFLLAQSYMPAQELQILKNGTSDWFDIPTSETFNTPEWRFEVKGPKRF